MSFTFTFSDKELVDLLNQIPQEQRDEYVQGQLKIAELVVSQLSLTVSPKGAEQRLADAIKPLAELVKSSGDQNLESLNKLSDMLSDLRGTKESSYKKGKLGEGLLESCVTSHFPSCELTNQVLSPHCCDFLFQRTPDSPKVLIEVKIYKNNVPTSEITKFHQDLQTTGIDYGVMCSLTSGIAFHHEFEIQDIIGGKKVMYIPNAGLDCKGVLYGLLLLEQIYVNSQSKEPNNQISIELTHLLDLLQQVSDVNKSLESVKSNLHKNIDRCIKPLETLLQQMETNFNDSLARLKDLIDSPPKTKNVTLK